MTRRLFSAAELPEGPATCTIRPGQIRGPAGFGFGDTVREKEQAITGNELLVESSYVRAGTTPSTPPLAAQGIG